MDEVTLRLNGYFEDIYAALTARGVPEDRLPTPWAILSHLLDCTDYEALGEWIENFAALEALDSEDTELEDADPDADEDSDGPPKRRPAYLRALPTGDHKRAVSSDLLDTDPPDSDPDLSGH